MTSQATLFGDAAPAHGDGPPSHAEPPAQGLGSTAPENRPGADSGGRHVTFSVVGNPLPQGSQQHRFVASLGRTVAHEKPSLLEWRRRVSYVAQSFATASLIEGPVEIELKFGFLRPKSVKKTRRFPTVAPDLDKLCRAIGDALEGVLYRSDAQIVRIVASKEYWQVPGVTITVREIA